MEQSWMMGMDLEQSWIIAGGVGAVLLIALVWFLLRRRSSGESDGETDRHPGEEIRLTEPTLEPLPDLADTPETAPDSEPDTIPEPEAGREAGPPPEPVSKPAPVPEQEPVSDSEPEPELQPEPKPAEAAPIALEANTQDQPAISDSAFLAAREAFERELLAGHFSRLDVFDAYARATEEADAPEVPRSEFFHHVVNEALATRDAFEALLAKEDRERFVDVHSRYLDQVTDESDREIREGLHREHQEALDSLRPGPAEARRND